MLATKSSTGVPLAPFGSSTSCLALRIHPQVPFQWWFAADIVVFKRLLSSEPKSTIYGGKGQGFEPSKPSEDGGMLATKYNHIWEVVSTLHEWWLSTW